MKRRSTLLAPLLIVLAALAAPSAASASGLTVFAAASLTDALRAIGAAWTASGHGAVVFSFASSSTLAQQIERGAPADLFASADEKWMDDLARHGGIATDTRADLLGNALVLVEPKASMKPVAIAAGFDIGAILGAEGRLAVGDPAHVPAGIYARQALTRLGVWNRASAHLATADSVRSALLLVERGEAPAGVVYATDARVSQGVAVAGVFPPASHDAIRYPFAVTKAGDTQEARAFLTYLRGDAARGVFARFGFAKP